MTDMMARATAAMSGDEKKSARKRSAIYDYQDRDGALLYQVLRYPIPQPPWKTFSQRRPDGNGGWIKNLHGVERRVLYRWPELLKFPDATVFVCEGEKDADNIAAPGQCATTVAAGKWTSDCVQALAGHDVIILADNDSAGHNKAKAAATALHGVAKTVRVVTLPGLADGEDVSDWLAQSRLNAIGRLIEISFNTPLCEPGIRTSEHEHPENVQMFRSDDASEQQQQQKAEPPKPELLPFIDMSRWDDEDPPEQEWAVPERIPLQQVTLFSGDGAVGKSRVELHLCAAHCLSREWLGTLPMSGPALFIDSEDKVQEIHRRAAAIARHYDVSITDMINGGLHTVSLLGLDTVLATVSKGGKIVATPLYVRVLEIAGDLKPRMIGIANSSNVFAGDETSRTQVQQFVNLLTRVAIVAEGALVLISHPSLTGITTGSGISGSTQWHNAVRARLYLKGIQPENGEQPDSDLRELVFKKNNYGPISESITLRYKDGLYLPISGGSSLDMLAREARAQETFLVLLRRFNEVNQRPVSDRKGTNFAPALFAAEKEAIDGGVTKNQLTDAMRELFRLEKITNKPRTDSRSDRGSFHIVLK